MPSALVTRVGRRAAGPLVSLLTLLLLLGALETTAGLLAAHRRAAALADPAAELLIEVDPVLGWRPVPRRDIPLPGPGRRFTSDERGFRRFDVASGRPLLLVLGDSFTQAAGVADGETYYDELARHLDLAVVALGVSGYGTTQELMLARSLGPGLPAPTLLLLQMADNDVLNDSWALERRSWLNNNLLPRPYLDAGGGTALRDPRRWFEHLTLGRELTRRLLATRLPTIERAIEAGEPRALALYRRELRPTAQALGELRRLFSGVPAVAFDVTGGESRIGADLERLAAEAGFTVVDVATAMRRRAAGRSLVQADGAHWNELGHELAGEALAGELGPLLERHAGREDQDGVREEHGAG